MAEKGNFKLLINMEDLKKIAGDLREIKSHDDKKDSLVNF